MKIDFEQQPPLYQVSETHYAATWLLHPNAPKVEPPESIKQRMRQFKAQKGGITLSEKDVILQVNNLKQYFNVGKPNEVKAVDDVSFHIYRGKHWG